MQMKDLQALTEFPHSPIGLQRILINACEFGDVKKVKRIIDYATVHQIVWDVRPAFSATAHAFPTRTAEVLTLLSTISVPPQSMVFTLLTTEERSMTPALLKWAVDNLQMHYDLDNQPQLVEQLKPLDIVRSAVGRLNKSQALECTNTVARYLNPQQCAMLTTLCLHLSYTACARVLIKGTTLDLMRSSLQMSGYSSDEKAYQWMENVFSKQQRSAIKKCLPKSTNTAMKRKM